MYVYFKYRIKDVRQKLNIALVYALTSRTRLIKSIKKKMNKNENKTYNVCFTLFDTSVVQQQ